MRCFSLRAVVIPFPDRCVQYGSLLSGGDLNPVRASGTEFPGLCCMTRLLVLLSSRWLWLMPNPRTAHFLRETEQTVIIACWRQPGPGHSVNTFSCNVGLFQPKTFQVPVTDLYIFIKNLFKNWSNDARASHWVQSEPCSLPCGVGGVILRSTSDAAWCPCLSAGRAILTGSQGQVIAGGVRFALVRNSLHFWHDIAFPKPPICFVGFMCLWLNSNSNNNTFFSILLARKHTYLSMFSFFPSKKSSYILILL